MNSIQIHSDRVARICCKANRFNALGAALFLPSLLAINSFAGSATWAPSSGATVGDWNTASNWSPQSVPNGSTDVATFAHSFTTGVSLSASAEVAVINFASSMQRLQALPAGRRFFSATPVRQTAHSPTMAGLPPLLAAA